jgi:tetratricopeptide (TPR) repeat protein
MAQNQQAADISIEIDRLATQLAKDPHSKVFMPLAEEYGKAGMWQEAAAVLEDGLKLYPGFITAMVALGRAYDQMGQTTKAKTILEESVKLSPENLRAHRTLIKIYTSQGLKELALQSCAVILAVNPRDEEARSVQSALGGPLTQEKEAKQHKPTGLLKSTLSPQQADASPAPVEFTASATKTNTVPDMTASPVNKSEIISADLLSVKEFLMETALLPEDQTGEQPAIAEPDVQTADTEVMPPPSPHQGAVAQLEAWLRAIESHRQDRDSTNEPQQKTS